MYCLLKNSCKYEYKCCNYCKQTCVDRCTDNCDKCKFFTKSEPITSHKFTVNGQEYSNVIEQSKKQSKSITIHNPQINKLSKSNKITKNNVTSNRLVKLKKKKSLI